MLRHHRLLLQKPALDWVRPISGQRVPDRRRPQKGHYAGPSDDDLLTGISTGVLKSLRTGQRTSLNQSYDGIAEIERKGVDILTGYNLVCGNNLA